MTIINIMFGLGAGAIFGYILTRTGITKYPRVVGMLLLKDFKILKFMLTAVISSMILFHFFGEIGWLKLVPKDLDWGKPVGGLIFGVGMALLGYCPGTMAARIGEKKKEPVFALFGMVTGILIYAILIKPVKRIFFAGAISGDIFLHTGISHWLIILPAALFFAGIIYFLNRAFSDNDQIF